MSRSGKRPRVEDPASQTKCYFSCQGSRSKKYVTQLCDKCKHSYCQPCILEVVKQASSSFIFDSRLKLTTPEVLARNAAYMKMYNDETYPTFNDGYAGEEHCAGSFVGFLNKVCIICRQKDYAVSMTSMENQFEREEDIILVEPSQYQTLEDFKQDVELKDTKSHHRRYFVHGKIDTPYSATKRQVLAELENSLLDFEVHEWTVYEQGELLKLKHQDRSHNSTLRKECTSEKMNPDVTKTMFTPSKEDIRKLSPLEFDTMTKRVLSSDNSKQSSSTQNLKYYITTHQSNKDQSRQNELGFLDQHRFVDNLRLLNQNNGSISGISTPNVLVCPKETLVFLHFEDCCLYSFNFLLLGGIKIWIMLDLMADDHFHFFIKIVNGLVYKKDNPNCPAVLSTKQYYMLLTTMISYGIGFKIVLHKESEFVFTYPRCAHQLYNSGWSIAEATNVAYEDWYQHVFNNYCMCKQVKPPMPSAVYPISEVFLDKDRFVLSGGHGMDITRIMDKLPFLSKIHELKKTIEGLHTPVDRLAVKESETPTTNSTPVTVTSGEQMHSASTSSTDDISLEVNTSSNSLVDFKTVMENLEGSGSLTPYRLVLQTLLYRKKILTYIPSPKLKSFPFSNYNDAKKTLDSVCENCSITNYSLFLCSKSKSRLMMCFQSQLDKENFRLKIDSIPSILERAAGLRVVE